MVVHVYKAQPVGEEPVADLHIYASDTMPTLPPGAVNYDLNAQMDIHRADAKLIADALYATLPGGTLDQLLREMLERRASHFVVRF